MCTKKYAYLIHYKHYTYQLSVEESLICNTAKGIKSHSLLHVFTSVLLYCRTIAQKMFFTKSSYIRTPGGQKYRLIIKLYILVICTYSSSDHCQPKYLVQIVPEWLKTNIFAIMSNITGEHPVEKRRSSPKLTK